MIALERMTSWLEAKKFRLSADMAPPGDPGVGEVACAKQFVREEIACALKLPVGRVNARLDVARELTTRLTDTLGLLESGDITARHATATYPVDRTMTPDQDQDPLGDPDPPPF